MAKTWLDPNTGRRVRRVTRKECGIPKSRAPGGKWKRRHGIAHHGVGRGNGLPLREVMAIWRGYYRYHVHDRGWTDIGYTDGWADAPDVGGAVLEGRSWGKDGGHTQNGGNVEGYAGCYIGDGRYAIADTAWSAWRAWLYDGVYNGAFVSPPDISGHDDWYPKVCPGPEIKHPLQAMSRLEAPEEEDELAYISEEDQKWLSEFAQASKARGVSPHSLGFWHKMWLAVRRQTTAHHGIDGGDADTLGVTIAHGANSGHRVDEVAKSEGYSIAGVIKGAIGLLKRDKE